MKCNVIRLVVAVAAVVVLAGTMALASELDDRIEVAARQSYVFRTYLKGDDIDVESRDGFVTLSGTVAEESHRKLAQDTLANLPGVINVENRLELKGEAPAENSDAWLKAKVKAALMLHSKSNSKTQVYVKDGVVTLKGEAATPEQKEGIGDYVKGIQGVKDIRNDMKVMNQEENHQTIGEKIDDTSITAQVKMALLSHHFSSIIYTKVQTNNGVVTIFGKAASLPEKEEITRIASAIKGVKNVDNRMTVDRSKM